MLRQRVDQPPAIPPGGFPAGWNEFPPGLMQPGDLVITKRQWGAFYGTELDLQLRRRGIRTLVLGGVATHIGVESTARQAYEHGYELLIVKDATTSSVAEGHEMSMKHILPRVGRLVQSSRHHADPPLASPNPGPAQDHASARGAQRTDVARDAERAEVGRAAGGIARLHRAACS